MRDNFHLSILLPRWKSPEVNFCFAGLNRRKVEIAESEISGDVEIYLVELVDIIDIRTGTVIISVPFRVCFRHSRFAYPFRPSESGRSTCPCPTDGTGNCEIQITVVSISGAYISGFAAGLHFRSIGRIRSAGNRGSQVLKHSTFLLTAGSSTLGSTFNWKHPECRDYIPVLNDDRAVHGRIFRLIFCA